MIRAWGWVRFILVVFFVVFPSTLLAAVSVIGSLDHFYIAKPGETIAGEIWVENTLSEPAIVRVEITDYFVDRWGQAQYPKPSNHARSLARYIQMMPPEQTLAPQARGLINFEVKLPTLKDHPELAGAYWAVLLIQPAGLNQTIIEPAINEFIITERFQTAVRITTAIDGAGTTQLEYRDATLTWPESATPSLAAALFEVDLVNSGDHLLDLQVVGELIDRDGQSIGVTPLTRLRLYPGHQRRVEWVLEAEGAGHEQVPEELWLMAHPLERMLQPKRFGGRFLLASP